MGYAEMDGIIYNLNDIPNMVDIWDSLSIYPYRDPRSYIDHKISCIRKGFTASFNYQTHNIFLHTQQIKKACRTYYKIQKKGKDRDITYNDAMFEFVLRLIKHETMHKTLFKTIGFEAAFKYDTLVGGTIDSKTNQSSSTSCVTGDDDLLP